MEAAVDTKLSWPAFVAEMKRPGSGPVMNWPNFFTVGVPKAGTTSLYAHLKRHPEVFLPVVKEVRIFQPDHPDSGYPARYRIRYADAQGYRAIGDTTPYYLVDPAVPARIREVCPDARIVIMLRDPVERAYAHYLTVKEINVTNVREPSPSFREALRLYETVSADQRRMLTIDYVEQGMYSAGVRRYLETFGAGQVLVLLLDDLERDPSQFFARVAQHIGVDPDIFSVLDVTQNANPHRSPRFAAVRWGQRAGLSRLLPRSFRQALRPVLFNLKKPKLDDDSRRQLQKIYDPDITRLEEFLGRRIPELRKSWIG